LGVFVGVSEERKASRRSGPTASLSSAAVQTA
jgi:hypothetical protein